MFVALAHCCATCGSTDGGLKYCQACYQVRYCSHSKACQRRAWRELGHSHSCSLPLPSVGSFRAAPAAQVLDWLAEFHGADADLSGRCLERLLQLEGEWGAEAGGHSIVAEEPLIPGEMELTPAGLDGKGGGGRRFGEGFIKACIAIVVSVVSLHSGDTGVQEKGRALLRALTRGNDADVASLLEAGAKV